MLTEQEKVRIQAIIRKRQYGITLSQMKQFFKKHQHAREIGDKKTITSAGCSYPGSMISCRK